MPIILVLVERVIFLPHFIEISCNYYIKSHKYSHVLLDLIAFKEIHQIKQILELSWLPRILIYNNLKIKISQDSVRI